MNFNVNKFLNNPSLLISPKFAGLGFDQDIKPDEQILYKDRNLSVPHYSVLLDDYDLCRAALTSGDAYVFRDDVNNTIILGYYNTYEQRIHHDEPKRKFDTNFKTLFDNGLLKKGNEQMFIWGGDRKTGSGWVEHQVKWFRENKIKQMMEFEKEYSPTPFIYFTRGVEPYTWKNFEQHLPQAVIAIVAIVATYYTAGLAAGAIPVLYKLLNTYIEKGHLNFKDVSEMAMEYAKTNLLDDKTVDNIAKTVGVTKDDIIKYYDYGNNLYNLITQPDSFEKYSSLAEVFGISDNKKLYSLITSVKKGDIQGFAKEFGIPNLWSEKMNIAVENMQLINGFANRTGQLKQKAMVLPNSLKVPEFQTYIVNTFSTLANGFNAGEDVNKLKERFFNSSGIPNLQQGLSIIAQNYDFKTVESFASVVNLAQLKFDRIEVADIGDIAVDALSEKAKNMKEQNLPFIMPSTVPSDLQAVIADEIYERTGIDSLTANSYEFS